MIQCHFSAWTSVSGWKWLKHRSRACGSKQRGCGFKKVQVLGFLVSGASLIRSLKWVQQHQFSLKIKQIHAKVCSLRQSKLSFIWLFGICTFGLLAFWHWAFWPFGLLAFGILAFWQTDIWHLDFWHSDFQHLAFWRTALRRFPLRFFLIPAASWATAASSATVLNFCDQVFMVILHILMFFFFKQAIPGLFFSSQTVGLYLSSPYRWCCLDFYNHLMPRPGFEPTSAELHQPWTFRRTLFQVSNHAMASFSYFFNANCSTASTYQQLVFLF